MDILVEPKAFQQTKSGTITGPIWLRHEGSDFPERGWSDFPVIVVGWWLKDLARLKAGAKNAVCSFMDGPFEFGVITEGANLWRLQLTERGLEANRLVSEFSVPATVLQAALHTTAVTILAECDHRAWTGRDVEDLRSFANPGRH